MRIGQERAETLSALVEQMDFLFVHEQEFAIDPASRERLEKTERAGEILDAVIEHVEACPWERSEDLDIRPVFEKLGIKPRKAMHVIYTAVGAALIWLAHADNIDRLLHGTERKFDLGLLAGKRSGGG